MDGLTMQLDTVAALANEVLPHLNSGNNNVSFNLVIGNESNEYNIGGYLMGKPDDDIDTKTGGISLDNIVNGIDIYSWLTNETDYFSISDVIECFNLYKVNADGDLIDGLTPIDSITLYITGSIYFEELEDGWYAVEEVLTEAGKNVFEQAPVMYIQIADGIMAGGAPDFAYAGPLLASSSIDHIISGKLHGFADSQPQLAPVYSTPPVFTHTPKAPVKAGTGWQLPDIRPEVSMASGQ